MPHCAAAAAASEPPKASTPPAPPASPTAAADEFHFLVLGDSQFHDPAGANRMYDDLIWLKPAFVIQVGDMIGGYVTAPELKAEWQRFAGQIDPLRRANIPFLPVPGNHDVFGPDKTPDATALAVYESIWGRAYYDFRYRNTHVVILNSDPLGAPNSLGPEQLEWLTERLGADSDTAAGVDHRLVFMHRPPAFMEDAEALHQLFKANGVSHVFYGHHHHYHHSVRDGVTYVMTNGTGNSGTDLAEAGSFDHLLQVSVRDRVLDYAVIRADSIEAPAYATPEDNYDLFALRRALEQLTPTLIEQTAAIAAGTARSTHRRYRGELTLSNPSQRSVTLHISCSSADQRMRSLPAKIEPLTLAPKEQHSLALTLRERTSSPAADEPACRVQFPYQVASGRWHLQEVLIPLRRRPSP